MEWVVPLNGQETGSFLGMYRICMFTNVIGSEKTCLVDKYFHFIYDYYKTPYVRHIQYTPQKLSFPVCSMEKLIPFCFHS